MGALEGCGNREARTKLKPNRLEEERLLQTSSVAMCLDDRDSGDNTHRS